MINRVYRVVRCPYCKTYQLTSAQKSFGCVSCGKSKSITKMRILFQSENPTISINVLKEIKKEDFRMRSKNDGLEDVSEDDFRSAF